MNLFYTARVTVKMILRRAMIIPSFCRKCGRNVHDFIVDDETWNMVAPMIWRGNTLCYDCFCDCCQKAGICSVYRIVEIGNGEGAMNKGGLSLRRLFGITKLKNTISRKTGIPWTRQGRKAKWSLWRW